MQHTLKNIHNSSDEDSHLQELASDISQATPSMQQYFQTKAKHPTELLFFRMGDFYEMFFEDAIRAAKILDIALTKRGRHKGEEIPMCGVPVSTAEMYLEKLILGGARVAICEQKESPEEAKKRGSKAVIRREVTRIVTPGTITEDTILDAKESSYICSISVAEKVASLAWAEISTGRFYCTTTELDILQSELARISPKEIIISTRATNDELLRSLLQDWRTIITERPDLDFDTNKATKTLQQFYSISAIDPLGLECKTEIEACGALAAYLILTQVENLPRMEKPQKENNLAVMIIDAATRRNLELVASFGGTRAGSLLGDIDFTQTNTGGRLLAERISSPLTNPEIINERLNSVEFFVAQKKLLENAINILKHFPDLERALSKICLERATPRDLATVQRSLECIKLLRQAFIEHNEKPVGEITSHLPHLEHHEHLRTKLAEALKSELPVNMHDGNFIREGYSAELDEFRILRDEGKQLIAALQLQYAEKSGISNLKIRHNNMLGFYLEITATHKDKALPEFIHRQTMAGAMRFTTVELKELESKITSAADKALSTELTIFAELVLAIKSTAEALAKSAKAIATIDVSCAMAELAISRKFARPIVDESYGLEITGGRHPVVESYLRRVERKTFAANSCNLGEEENLWLLTGPNMAGKSTFLRQNALIVILAQAGSFVPAEKARIGVVDKLFSRVGASDDLARGRSTFMVEMVETATILNQSTARSLVILDEIGRGTATYDGLAIAWATIEFLHNRIKCRALFATHYHELTVLASKLPHLRCHTMKVKEWKGDVVFLHEVIPGTADRSYGIHVAKLAGLPPEVIVRAMEVLSSLEKNKKVSPLNTIDELPLFSTAPEKSDAGNGRDSEPFINTIENLNPDEMSPKDALDAIYKLKELLK